MGQDITDPFEAYVHDIRDLPLLRVEDEQRFFAQISQGREASQRLRDEPSLAPEAHAALAQAIADGERARDTVIGAHLRLVVRIARQYTSRGVSLLDLIQEGNVALLQAIEHFDPGHGVRFATYATWWIRHAISRAVAELKEPVHLPDDVRHKLYRVHRAHNDLLQQLGREPRDDELAARSSLRLDELRKLRHFAQPLLSLDAPIDAEEDTELADVVPDPFSELQVSTAQQAALSQELDGLLRQLTEAERQVLIHRFGLDGEPLKTRQEVARLLDLSSERVQRLEGRALRKLRNPDLLQRLQEFAEW